MADINRDDDTVELAHPPRFAMGERVASRIVIRNDGTYRGHDIGDVLVHKGDVGYVRSIGTFLQQFYIYAVEFTDQRSPGGHARQGTVHARPPARRGDRRSSASVPRCCVNCAESTTGEPR